MDLRGYFDNVRDPRWGPSEWERPAVNGHGRPAPRARRVQRPDRPAARNPDGSLRAQAIGDRSPAERARIEAALDYIRSFEAR
jgi:hypothetical protein